MEKVRGSKHTSFQVTIARNFPITEYKKKCCTVLDFIINKPGRLNLKAYLLEICMTEANLLHIKKK